MPHSTSVRMSTTTTDDDPFGFQNIGDALYTGTIFVSGQPFIVQIDTGSSDLWIDSSNVTLDNLFDTGVVGSVFYLDTTGAVGNIKTGNVTWGEFVVPNQAFIDAPGSNATSGGLIQGLIGVGPPNLSTIDPTLQSANSTVDGSAFLDNVFAYYPDEPNFITFMLSRSEMGTVDGGEFTIGDVVQNFSAITDTPKLPVLADDAWFIFMDAVEINDITMYGGSQGNPKFTVPDNQTIALLDTGTSLATAPRAYVDAIYNVTGAKFDDESGFYIVPCDTKINVTMVFGGLKSPMNPLDLVLPAGVDDDGSIICVGVMSYTPDGSGLDFILGDVFMRNVYSLFDFGNWAKVGDSDPFVQVLSVTDAEQAWADFDKLNKARLDAFLASQSSDSDSTTTTAASKPVQTNSSGSGIKSATGALGDSDSSTPDLSNLTRLSYVIIGLLALVVLLLIGTVVSFIMKSRSSAGKGYKTIKDPFPPAHEKAYEGSYADYSTPYADGGHH
ncbi:hypothetical protein QCA50_015200 [Cerrena zonata]|uniref:Peptidase A1 domain-containing protein n=1 Tax=Cerrena zonata TaxID=2478898 RepID=A0AAW0FL36_9APHY